MGRARLGLAVVHPKRTKRGTLIRALVKHNKITLAIISALAGAVLGTVVQDMLKSSFSFLMAIVGLVSLAVLALLASEVARENSRRRADEQVTTEMKAISAEVKGSHDEQRAHLDSVSDKLISSMIALSSQFGLQVGRLLQSEVNSFSSAGEDPSAKMILAAKEELCILDIVAEDGSWPDESMDPALLGGVFKQIIARVQNLSPSLSYRRIIQVAHPGAGLRKVRNATLLEHCSDILAIRQEGGCRAALKIAKRRFPFKFALIDSSSLILQLQEYGGNCDSFVLWGELQVSDPSRDFVSIFREIWDQIDDADETRHLTRHDLPSTPNMPRD